MKRPLYKTPVQLSSCPPQANAGLWFDKFCHTWSGDRDDPSSWSLKAGENGNPKLDWIRTVTHRPVGDAAALENHAIRLAGLVEALGGHVLVFQTTSRLAVGLGRQHPIENGFSWHPTLGTPYLPGSSVKGLVRAWVEAPFSGDSVESTRFERIFGSGKRTGPSSQPPRACGSVLFFDALPWKPVRLKPDVMTVHYAPYYQGLSRSPHGIVPPADWLQPEPIPFLTVAPGALFLFALAPRTPSTEDRHDCQRAAAWLTAALQELGAGAKTAVGYGRFAQAQAEQEKLLQRLRDWKQQREQQTRLARLSPLARELETDIAKYKWETDKNAFSRGDLVERWVGRLEKDPVPDALQRLKALLEKHFPGILANPDKTRGKTKDKEYAYKERWRNVAKRLNQIPT